MFVKNSNLVTLPRRRLIAESKWKPGCVVEGPSSVLNSTALTALFLMVLTRLLR